MKNPNRPQKGSQTTVEPIRYSKDIKNIRKLLKDSPRNLCLFVLGINTNLRASHLLSQCKQSGFEAQWNQNVR